MTLDEPPSLEAAPARIRRLVHALDTDRGTRRLMYVIIGLVVLAVALLIGWGGNRPRDPSLVDQSIRLSGRIPGFGEARLTVTLGRRVHHGCVAVADSQAQREQGLMGRSDLAGYDGMVFRFPEATTARFYMRNTPLPLSIAWFDGDGRYVSSADMVPCPDVPTCPTYGADGPYRLALEVERGRLPRLGVGAGASVLVGGAC